jgi:hypothetical protein
MVFPGMRRITLKVPALSCGVLNPTFNYSNLDPRMALRPLGEGEGLQKSKALADPPPLPDPLPHPPEP